MCLKFGTTVNVNAKTEYEVHISYVLKMTILLLLVTAVEISAEF